MIVNYRNDSKSAQSIVKQIESFGGKAIAVKADVFTKEGIDKLFDAVKNTFSKIDVLVNNAASFDNNDSPDNTEAFLRIFEANLLAQIQITNAARKLMKKGKIIFVSSIHGKLGHGRPDVIAYSSMKAALESYMKNLAKYLAPDILVNAVSPGRTLTPMWGDMTDEYKKRQASGHLINRWIEPTEIADGILFLARNDAVCGEVLVIDGGMSLKILG